MMWSLNPGKEEIFSSKL